ncbi:MAG: ATP-binding protein [Candidatus Competibacterales bacterium]|nr:ATP-binding protein [Candidatus Competibacterales bacterium]
MSTHSPTAKALRIAAIYLVCGALWIYLSDNLIADLAPEVTLLSAYQTLKGWAFVLLTALLLFLLVRAALRRQAELLERLRALNAELEQRVTERTAQLEASNQELESFVYTVSHDLKAPLRGIDGYSRLLVSDCGDALTGDCRLFVDQIRSGVGQATALIDDLLAYSRVERRTLAPQPLDLNALVDTVLDGLSREIRTRDARIELQLPPLSVRADPDGLVLVLRNLLDNALKFTRPGEPPMITIGGHRAADGTVLWIRDRGIGFDMKHHDRLYEIFHRLQPNGDYPGTGIGLALVRKAMERMGGRIRAEGTPGAGATFHLLLPR